MILCYKGLPYERAYMLEKSKRLVWKNCDGLHWCYDFEDLRDLYKRLFEEWDNPDCWEEAHIFVG